jgi:hypothetical protein
MEQNKEERPGNSTWPFFGTAGITWLLLALLALEEALGVQQGFNVNL